MKTAKEAADGLRILRIVLDGDDKLSAAQTDTIDTAAKDAIDVLEEYARRDECQPLNEKTSLELRRWCEEQRASLPNHVHYFAEATLAVLNERERDKEHICKLQEELASLPVKFSCGCLYHRKFNGGAPAHFRVEACVYHRDGSPAVIDAEQRIAKALAVVADWERVSSLDNPVGKLCVQVRKELQP